MKKFIKGRWFPLLAALVIEGIVSAILICLGFKITYAPEMENNWDAVSAVAACVGVIGTIAVLWYNHRSISLAQRSVQQAINLQLYEKRLELYTALSRNDAFKETPLEVKIVYSEIAYTLYKQLNDLCNQKEKLMDELYQLTAFLDGRAESCWNVGEEQFQKYMQQLDSYINGADGRHKDSLLHHKNESQKVQDQIKSKYRTLETMMRAVINDSIKN